jgi:hypothetical protein
MKKSGSIAGRTALGLFTIMTLAFGQRDEAMQGCRAHAALSTSAYFDDIYVVIARGGRVNLRSNTNFALTWEAWVSDEKAITGTCESDPRGTIVEFQRLAEKTGRKPGGTGNAGGGGTATADNDGTGTFSMFRFNMNVTHAHVVLASGRGTVTLSGNGSRFTLAGRVSRQISDREFEITVDTTDRGQNANGTILLRMTPGHNEVEELTINGANGRQTFNGSFRK